MKKHFKKFIHYFSQNSSRTLSMLFIGLITALYFSAFLNPLEKTKESTQKIAEEGESSCTPCQGYYGDGVCLNHFQVGFETPSCLGTEKSVGTLLQGENCSAVDEWCYTVTESSTATPTDTAQNPAVTYFPPQTTSSPRNPTTTTAATIAPTRTSSNETQEENEEDNTSQESCGPEDLSDSGEFDNACYETQKCATDEQKGAWCTCSSDRECASKKCSIPDGFDREYCEKMPEPTDTEDEENQGTPQEIAVSLQATLPGIGTNTTLGQNNNPLKKTRPFYVHFLDSQGEVVEEAETSLTYANGTYTGTLTTTIPEGNYTISVASDNSLFKSVPRVIAVSVQNKDFSMPAVTLVTGNIAQNDMSKNNLDIFDYNALLSCYNGKSCSIQSLADLNDDGKVNALDLNILLRSLTIQRE